MRDKEERRVPRAELLERLEALTLEFRISDREDFVEEEDGRVEIRGDRKGEPNLHAR